MYKLVLICVIVLFCSSAFGQRGHGFNLVSTTKFYELINEYNNEIIIDTRGKNSYENRKIVDAINIGTMDELKAFCDTIDLDTPLFVYCDVGTKSRYVCKFLSDHEFKNVYNLKGGIVKWAKAELPIDEK